MTEIECVKSLLPLINVNFETGIINWNSSRRKNLSGKDAGYKNPRGYIIVTHKNKRIYAHRIIFFYVHGYFPKMIDHINRNPSDNRISNIRECTPFENEMNKGLSKNNTSGHKGISWRKKTKRWRAHIKKDYKQIELGSFKYKKDAITARQNAEKIYHV